ncbi:MAG: thiamine biosynthesis protein ThiF, partial [Cellulomonas sp.]
MRLRPGLDLLWRAPGEVQIGTDPRWAVRLSGMTDIEVDVLTEAEPGATVESLRASAARHGLA